MMSTCSLVHVSKLLEQTNFLFEWNSEFFLLKFFNITRIFSTLWRALSSLLAATLINSSSCENFKLLQEAARNEKVKNFFCLFLLCLFNFVYFFQLLFSFQFSCFFSRAAEVLEKSQQKGRNKLFHFCSNENFILWFLLNDNLNWKLFIFWHEIYETEEFSKISFKTSEMNFNYVSKISGNSNSLKYNFVWKIILPSISWKPRKPKPNLKDEHFEMRIISKIFHGSFPSLRSSWRFLKPWNSSGESFKVFSIIHTRIRDEMSDLKKINISFVAALKEMKNVLTFATLKESLNFLVIICRDSRFQFLV